MIYKLTIFNSTGGSRQFNFLSPPRVSHLKRVIERDEFDDPEYAEFNRELLDIATHGDVPKLGEETCVWKHVYFAGVLVGKMKLKSEETVDNSYWV